MDRIPSTSLLNSGAAHTTPWASQPDIAVVCKHILRLSFCDYRVWQSAIRSDSDPKQHKSKEERLKPISEQMAFFKCQTRSG